MKHLLTTLFAALLSYVATAQITFEPGYIILNNDAKTECLIENLEWRYNPAEIKYKLTEDSEERTGTAENIKEFGMNNQSKYIIRKVKIDRSSEELDNLSTKQQPEFREEKLVLKVLIEGKANLYEYTKPDLTRFFFSTEDSEIEQLIYKSFRTNDQKINKNTWYKQQLWNSLTCNSITMTRINNLNYSKGSLINFFASYHKCNDAEFVKHIGKAKKNIFSLNVRPGMNLSSYTHNNGSKIFEFDSQFTFRFGVEAEFILPFNKNKWTLFTEPTYQYYDSEADMGTYVATFKYQSIELPIGLRHYLFLNENSKLFVNVALVLDQQLNSKPSFYQYSVATIESKTDFNLAYGLGFKYKNTFSVELRKHTDRNLFLKYQKQISDYQTTSLILGYTIIKNKRSR